MLSTALDIQENVPLAPYTTLKIGGPARFFCAVTTSGQLVEAVKFARSRGTPLFVLGGGSNLLVSDAGFPGLVIHATLGDETAGDGGSVDLRPSATELIRRVPAGLDWDSFVLQIVEEGISGIECLAGIPGFVGASPIQNIGAYGQEVSSSINAVRALDLEMLDFVSISAEECGFGYRKSIFNSTHRSRYVVTEVDFRFDLAAGPLLQYADLKAYFADSTNQPSALEVYRAVRDIRARKGMLLVEGEPDCRSAGSFFKNPIITASKLTAVAASLHLTEEEIPHWAAGAGHYKLPAAWLLERAGFHKGFALGEAGISSRHTLALINRGHATFADMAALRDRVITEIQQHFQIGLEQEPVQIGE